MKRTLIGFMFGVCFCGLGLWLIAARPQEQDIDEELSRHVYNNFIQRGTELATSLEVRVRLPVPYATERYHILLQVNTGTAHLRAYVIDNKSFGVIVSPQVAPTARGGVQQLHGLCKFFWVTVGKKLP